MRNTNVTAGDCLNETLRDGRGEWVPFREAMLRGEAPGRLFSEEFCRGRSRALGVQVEEYTDKLCGFLCILENPNAHDRVTLWFGDEPFCVRNRETVIAALREYGFTGEIVLNVVTEPEGKPVRTEIVQRGTGLPGDGQ